MRPAVRSASDPQQVKRAGQRAELQRRQQLADLAMVVSLPEGRRVLWRIFVQAKGKDTTWHDNPHNVVAAAAQREIALWLESEIMRAEPEAMLLIRREELDRELNRDYQEESFAQAEAAQAGGENDV